MEDVQILGPILVAGAVAGGALIVSLFVTPRSDSGGNLGEQQLYVATSDVLGGGAKDARNGFGTGWTDGTGWFGRGGDANSDAVGHAVGHTVGFAGENASDERPMVVPMIALVPASRTAPTGDEPGDPDAPRGVFARFVGPDGAEALRSFVQQVERIASGNKGS